MTEIKPSEVSQILKQELSNLNNQTSLDETGTVLAVGDGIARLYGLTNVVIPDRSKRVSRPFFNAIRHGYMAGIQRRKSYRSLHQTQ